MTLLAITLCAAVSTHVAEVGPEPIVWGADGHRMAARAAVEALPDGIPGFFT